MEKVEFDIWLNGNETDYFVALCRDIVGQQLSGKAANTIFGRFAEIFGGKITPKKVLKMDDQNLRDAGLSWAKVSYVKNLAQHVDDKILNLELFDTLPDENIIAELTKVKGIGTWTAEMFLMFVLKRENVFSHGDLGLKKGLEKIYKRKNLTKKQIERIVSKWEPYKTYGSFTLWQSLEKE